MTTRGPAPTVARVRGERGQTATELLGMLLVVSVIVGAVATSQAGAVIKRESRRIVCEIAGGECATAQAAPIAHLADHHRPPLGGRGPITVLPFPGSVAVSCTYDERSPELCSGSDANGVSVTIDGEAKVERTPTTLDANGCPWQSASVSTSLKLTGKLKGGNEKVGGSLSA